MIHYRAPGGDCLALGLNFGYGDGVFYAAWLWMEVGTLEMSLRGFKLGRETAWLKRDWSAVAKWLIERDLAVIDMDSAEALVESHSPHEVITPEGRWTVH